MAESTLLDRLRLCDILSPEQMAELETLPEAANPDPRVLGKVVFQRGWLTRFQINQVASGKGKDLLVGPYLLIDRLGEGGMGQVFKARHRHMKRTVALKLIRKEKLASADAVHRFYQEVEAAAQLHHPNIVLAFDAGQAGSTHFFAMEYVEGPDLTRLVREKGALPVVQACDFIRQAAVGLQHAHERGLVHRDVKPSNLLVTASGEPVVKILDLGLARLGDSFAKERNLTRMGQVIGTPDYLAPEQALDARNVDIRADLYSLGCSLYFLLATRPPFQAEALTELLMKHQIDEPPSIRTLRADVPTGVEKLIRRLMAKKPEERPDSPAEVAAALEPFTRGEKGGAAPALSLALDPVQPGLGETWAGISADGAGALVRPPARANRDRSRDTIDEKPRPRRKPEKSNRALLVGGAIGAGVFVLSLVILGIVLLSGRTPEKAVVQNAGGQVQAQGQGGAGKRLVKPKEDVSGKLLALVAQAVRDGKVTRTKQAGAVWGDSDVSETPPEGALLTGFELGIGKFGPQDVIQAFRPIYQTASGRVLGAAVGGPKDRTVTLEAKPGYAVGGMTINGGAALDGLSLDFMAIESTRLNPEKSYQSEWAGGMGGNRHTVGGDGNPVVGVFGRLDTRQAKATGLGLVLLSQTGGNTPGQQIGDGSVFAAVEEMANQGKTTRTQQVGGGTDPFEAYTKSGLLTGLEVGLGKWNNQDVIHSLRPIYQTRRGRVYGQLQGVRTSRTAVIEAKPGYAIGELTVSAGQGIDGLSARFMPVEAGALNPNSSYFSEWVGGRGGRQQTLGGSGALVVGIFGKRNGATGVSDGLGLVTVTLPPKTPLKQYMAMTLPRTGKDIFCCVRTLDRAAGQFVHGAAFSADGKRSLSLIEQELVIHDLSSGKVVRAMSVGPSSVMGLAASRDWKQVLVRLGNSLQRWDVEAGKALPDLEDGNSVLFSKAFGVAGDGKYAAAGTRAKAGDNYEIRLWNLETGKVEHRFEFSKFPPTSLAFTDDGKYLVVSGIDVRLKLWDLRSKKEHTVALPRLFGPTNVAPAGGSKVLLGALDGQVQIWDADRGGEGKFFSGRHTAAVHAMAVSQDQRFAVSTAMGYDGVPEGVVPKDIDFRVWDVDKAREIGRLPVPETGSFVTISADGKFALLGDSKDLYYLSLERFLPRDTAPVAPVKLNLGETAFAGHKGAITALGLSSDGKSLAGGDGEGTVLTWDAATGRLKKTVRAAHGKNPKPNAVRAVRFAFGDSKLLTLDQSRMATLFNLNDKGWNGHDAGFRLEPGEAYGMDVAPDNLMVVAMGKYIVPMPVGENQIGRWRQHQPPQPVTCVVSLQQGSRFALADPSGSVRVATVGERSMSYRSPLSLHKEPILAMAYDAKSKRLFSASEDKTVAVASLLVRSSKVRRLSGHEGAVTCLALSPDGKYLASGSKDRTVRLWNLTSLQEIHRYTGDSEINAVVFSPDGKNIYLAGKAIRVWSIPEIRP